MENTTVAFFTTDAAHVVSDEANSGDDLFNSVVGVWLPGILCITGFLGNMLSLLVLSLDRTNDPTFYSLRALALSDVILLIGAFFQQVLPMYYEFELQSQCPYFLTIKGYIRVYTWPIICITQMTSIWLAVLISAERYLAVVHPFQSINMRTIPKVRLAIIVITVCCALFNIPRFFEFQPVGEVSPTCNYTVTSVGTTEVRKNPVYRYLYSTALFGLLIYAVPLAVLASLNIRVVVEMRRAKRHWATLNRKQQREVAASVMPLVIVVVFILCSTQALLTFIFDAVYVTTSPPWLQKYFAIVNLLVIFNSAANFFIFYLFGKKFRKISKRMLRCRMQPVHQNGSVYRLGWRKSTME